LPFPLEDLDGASTILLLGTNVAETMPPFIGHLAGVVRLLPLDGTVASPAGPPRLVCSAAASVGIVQTSS